MLSEEKNLNAIDKIIARLSLRDYHAVYDKLSKAKRNRIRDGKASFSYSLGLDTEEAIRLKNDYVNNIITEEDYKAYCLRHNLINLS